jgi:hypothetical protein
MNEETTTKHWSVVKKAVNGERGFRNDVSIVNIRTLPLDRAQSTQRAGRGQAREEANNHRGKIASAAPTQSKLESTLKWRARTEKREA